MEPFIVFVIGPAGTGKTTFVSSFGDFVEAQGVAVTRVNLDPAAEHLPYVPDVDIREHVFARRVMEEKGLGPNGAIIASVDMILEHLREIEESISKEGYILVDTPGQMEVFVFRRSGVEIARRLTRDRRAAVVFIHDVLLALSPSSFISQAFLAAASYYRLKMPFLNVFNKIDLVEPEQLDMVKAWIESIEALKVSLEEEVAGEIRLLNMNLLRALSDFIFSFSAFYVSSARMLGLDAVFAALQRLYTGGDMPA